MVKSNRRYSTLGLLLALPVVVALLAFPSLRSRGAGGRGLDPYKGAVPNVDVNAKSAALRKANSAQLGALDQFKSSYGNTTSVRWNAFAGSPDVMMGFHTGPSSDTPENAARSFVAANSTLFGVDPTALKLVDQKEAMGGYMVKFQQSVGGVNVVNGGLGFVMTADKQIRMVMGSTFRDVTVPAAPALTADAAAASAQAAIARYAVSSPAAAQQAAKPAIDALAAEMAPVLRQPKLNIFPTADGYKLAWNVITFSRNPLGVFITQVDANSGQILARESKMLAQSALPYTADIYPNHPVVQNPDTDQLKLNSLNEPEGLLRVQLRNYNEGTNATGVAGSLSGPHAMIRNVLAGQQPFAQAALGTWHFRQNNSKLSRMKQTI